MRFQHTSPMYTFTTENINGYFHQINFTNKKVLTVCGSGDHPINAYLMKAKKVTCFDINNNAKYITDLKFAAQKTLTFEEFMKFFMRGNGENTNPDAFKHSIYTMLRNKLPKNTKLFFNSLYKENNLDGHQIRNGKNFNNNYDNNQLKIFSNPYLQSAKTYNQAQTQLKPFNWIQSDLKDLRNKLNKKLFDIILLSNISDYAHEMFPNQKNYLEAYLKEIILPLKKNSLQPDGIICAGYVYDYETKLNKKQPRSQIDNPVIRTSSLIGIKHKIITFPSVIKGKTDAIITL